MIVSKTYLTYLFLGICSAAVLGVGLFGIQSSFGGEEPIPGVGADLRIIRVPQGGTGTSTRPMYGQLLLGRADGEYDLVATSTLGITGSAGAAAAGTDKWATSTNDSTAIEPNSAARVRTRLASSTATDALDGFFAGRTATTSIYGNNATSTFAGGIANVNAGGISTTQGLTITGGSILNTSVSTSTFSGALSLTNLRAANGVNVTGGSLQVANITSAAPITDANGSFIEYAGTSCTNQFIRSLSALIAGGCATVANTDLANSSLTVTAGSQLTGGGVVSLGGTVTLALNSSINFFSASSTILGATSTIYVGTTASTTIVGNNATSTFAGGIASINAGGLSSTNGLTITAGSISNQSTATSTFAGGLSTVGLASSQGLVVTGGSIKISSGATSTSNNGWDITAGCYAKSSTCLQAADIGASRIGNSTYSNTQNLMNLVASPGITSGGTLATTTNAASLAALTGFIRATDDNTSTISFFDAIASSSIGVPANTTRYVGIEYNGGTPRATSSASRSIFDLDTSFPAGTVVNDGSNVYAIGRPWQTGDPIGNIIEWIDAQGLVQIDRRPEHAGIVLSSSGTRNLAITSGQLLSRLSEIPFIAFDSSGTGRLDRYYRNGSGGWTKEAQQTQIPNATYDNNSGTLASASLLSYVPHWIYTCADTLTTAQVVMLYGQADYSSLATAQASTPPATVPSRVSEMCTLRGRYITQQGSNTVAEVITYNSIPTSGTAALAHSSLSNLAWTSSGHTGTAQTMPYFGTSGVAAETSTSSITAANASLTFTGSGAVVGSAVTAQINNAFSHSWTVLQNFTYASTTALSALDALQVGRTATTTIKGDNATSTFAGGISSINAGGITSANGITVTGGSIRNDSTATSTFAGGLSITSIGATQGITITGGSYLSTSVSTSTWAGGHALTSLSASAGLTVTGGSILNTSVATSTWSGGLSTVGLSTSQGLVLSGGALSYTSSATGTFSGAGGLVFSNTSAAMVGIGTSTPFARLTVSGGAIVNTETTLATSTSMTLDWRQSNQLLVRIGTSATTLNFSNAIEGQTQRVMVCNPGAGTAGTITWDTRILWAGGTKPTQTTTVNKCDVWSFIATNGTSTLKFFGAASVNY